MVDGFVAGTLDRDGEAELAAQVAGLTPFHWRLPNAAAMSRVVTHLGGEHELLGWLDQHPDTPRLLARLYVLIGLLDRFSDDPAVVTALAELRAQAPDPPAFAGYLVPDTNSTTLASLATQIESLLADRRVMALRAVERQWGSRVITLIHRQESLSFFGLPFARYIDIDDSEEVLRAIDLTDPQMPIDMVLHTPGGLVLAAEQIAYALQKHPAKVTVMVPHYAMSGGTLIALAADGILVAPTAVLGPVDPQLGEYAAASILAAVGRKDVNEIDDKTLILADVSRKAARRVSGRRRRPA